MDIPSAGENTDRNAGGGIFSLTSEPPVAYKKQMYNQAAKDAYGLKSTTMST